MFIYLLLKPCRFRSCKIAWCCLYVGTLPVQQLVLLLGLFAIAVCCCWVLGSLVIVDIQRACCRFFAGCFGCPACRLLLSYGKCWLIDASGEDMTKKKFTKQAGQSQVQTLGTKDTNSNSKSHEDTGRVLDETTKKSFASLFKFNRNPSKGISLFKVKSKEYVVEVDYQEFDNEKERQKILDGGPYMIYGKPLILKNMPPLFEFGACTNTVVPVWVTLLGLPVDLWNTQVLAKICSKITEPLCTDAMIGWKERIFYARVLVEVDIAKELVKEQGKEMEEGQNKTCSVVHKTPYMGIQMDVQRADKGVQKKITRTLVEKGAKRIPTKDKDKPMGKNEATTLERRKGPPFIFHDHEYRMVEYSNVVGFGLLETKLEEGKLFDIMKWKFREWKVMYNFNMHAAGRMVIIWNPRLASVDVTEVTSQAIYTSITCKIFLKNFWVSFVYGLHLVVERRPILKGDDRQGQTQVSSYEVRDFLNLRGFGIDGSFTTSMEEINGELLTLYVKLLGSHHEVHGFDVMVLEVGPKIGSYESVLQGIETYGLDLISLTDFYRAWSTMCKGVMEYHVLEQAAGWSRAEGYKEMYAWLDDFEVAELFIARAQQFGKSGMEHHVLRKQQGSIVLRNTRRWNDALLSKALWNIHDKKDTLWCQWIHHYYIKGGTIWAVAARDKLAEAEGLVSGAIHRVFSWLIGGAFNTAEPYDYFKPKGHPQGTPHHFPTMMLVEWSQRINQRNPLHPSFRIIEILAKEFHCSKWESRRDAITRLSSSWKPPNKFYIYKLGWLVFQFDREEDIQKILDRRPYMIYGRPLILKNMPPHFELGACTSIVVPVWITLPGLPVDLWNAQALAKICSRIGEPLCIDAMTRRKERISYTRVLVEVDIAKELITELPIKLPNGLNHGLEETPQCPSGDITNEGQGDHLKKNSKQGMNESGKQRIELEGGQKENTIAEDKLVETEGSIAGAIDHVAAWVLGINLHTSETYEYFKLAGQNQIWAKGMEHHQRMGRAKKEHVHNQQQP
ncbi:hypothetical protein M9H77_29967 [Catharanthus roseus]|uniref:Uncharacterized protein n=1 Tax=Catharanthus roseus TaxID=4058 RepID=A0ACB9ZVY3_CATRO|nr:hypothetical protein M9H77_29967 [Catharanthus roseus]